MCNDHSTIQMNFNNLHSGNGYKEWREKWKNDPIGLFFGVDSCIAEDVRKMNIEQQINTLTSCCFHGATIPENNGQIIIDSHSVYNALKHGYDVRVNNTRWWDREDGAEDEHTIYEIKIPPKRIFK